MTDERKLRERVVEAILGLHEHPGHDRHDLAAADRAIAICREHYGAEIARLTRERDEAYTRGWNDAAKPGSAVLAEKIEGVMRRALRKEEGDA